MSPRYHTGPKEWVPGGIVPWMLPWKHVMTRQYHEGGLRRRIRAEYGMRQIGDQDPYFSVTGDVRELHRSTWAHVVSGAIHEEVERHLPELAPFLKWHLATWKGTMHYLANAGWWWDAVSGRREERERVDPLEAFMNTIAFGALEDDVLPPTDTPTEEVVEWLRARLPALRRAFREDMRRAYELQI